MKIGNDQLTFLGLTWPRLKLARIQRLGREFLWICFGQLLSISGGLIGVRLLTGVLSPDKYGELALVMTFATFANQLVFGPLSNAFMRFFALALEKQNLTPYLQGIGILLIRGTLVLLLTSGIGILGFLVIGNLKWMILIILAVILSTLLGYNSALDCIQNAARQRPIVALHQGLGQWGRYLIATGLILILGKSSSMGVSGYIISAIAVLFSQYFFFRRKILSLARGESTPLAAEVESWQKQMTAYALPFASWGIFTWAQLASDRWALQTFSHTSDVGLYAVLFQLGYYPIVMVSGLVMQLVTPVVFSKAGTGKEINRLRRVYKFNAQLTAGSLLIAVLAAGVMFLFHREIFTLLVAPTYYRASNLLPLMGLAGGLFAAGQSATLFLTINTNTSPLIKPKILTACFGVALNFAGAYLFGLTGVILGVVVFSLLYLLWIMWLIKREYQHLI